MDRASWYWRRLRSMSANEIAGRANDAGTTLYEWAFLKGKTPRLPPGLDNPGWIRRNVVVSCHDDERRLIALLDAADHQVDDLMRREFSLLGSTATFDGDIDWHYDCKTGSRGPLTFSKSIDYRFSERLSVRHIWELNRHQYWVRLAAAHFLTKRAAYSEEVWTQWRGWLDANPPLLGVNWASSLELGLRLVSWAFALQLLDDPPAELRRPILESVTTQCRHIARNLSRGSSANNHLVGEALGLYTSGSIFPAITGAESFRRLGRDRLIEAILAQTFHDGVDREQATGYHVFKLEMYLVAALIGRAAGDDFPKPYWSLLESMTNYVAAISNSAGELPQLGDSDDAEVVTFMRPDRRNKVRSILATASVLFHRPDLKTLAGAIDAHTLWLLGPDAADAFRGIEPKRESPTPVAFPDGGVYVIRSLSDTGRDVHLVADAGPLGLGAIAAHGHADALSFILTLDGEMLLVDPGTFCYNTEPRWREYFKGTVAHNTLVVDGRNQSMSVGPTLWVEHANVRVLAWNVTSTDVELVAEHDGYAPIGIVHRRTLRLHRPSGQVTITDVLGGAAATHHVSLHLHFPSSVRVHLDGDRALVRGSGARLEIVLPDGLNHEVIREATEPILGWYSPSFGHKEAACTLRSSGQASSRTTYETRLEPVEPERPVPTRR